MHQTVKSVFKNKNKKRNAKEASKIVTWVDCDHCKCRPTFRVAHHSVLHRNAAQKDNVDQIAQLKHFADRSQRSVLAERVARKSAVVRNKRMSTHVAESSQLDKNLALFLSQHVDTKSNDIKRTSAG